MGVGGQRHAPAALPPVKIRYPLYRRLDQSVASRYTDCALAAHPNYWWHVKHSAIHKF